MTIMPECNAPAAAVLLHRRWTTKRRAPRAKRGAHELMFRTHPPLGVLLATFFAMS